MFYNRIHKGHQKVQTRNLPFVADWLEDPFFNTFPAAGLLAARVLLLVATKSRALPVDLHEILLLVID